MIGSSPEAMGDRAAIGAPDVATVFRTFLLLGLTSFGGPIAHLGYFREALVERRRWLTDADYADIVATCQVLPGPTSSQVGLMIGQRMAGARGALAAWAGFTLPSALVMVAFAFGLDLTASDLADGAIHGLQLVAVAVVAKAVADMARTLWPDRTAATVGVAAAVVALTWDHPAAQVAVIAAAAVAGLVIARARPTQPVAPVSEVEPDTGPGAGRGRLVAAGCLAAFALLLVALPALARATDSRLVGIADGFYRSGALVFGGGHVVLPLLEAEVVPPGWVSPDDFAAGYGLAQAVPGPLFTFGAYLGAVAGGGAGAIVALAAIFLPSFLLVFGIGPFRAALLRRAGVAAALAGVNAAVVGVLLAALYDPIWVTAVRRPADAALALALFAALTWWRAPPWLVVVAGVAGGVAITR